MRSLWVRFGQDPRKVLGTRNLAPCRDSIEEGGGLGFVWPRGALKGLWDTGGTKPGDTG